jgi:hypothetical protein
LPARAQDPDSTSEFWPECDIFIKLNLKSRIFVLYAGTKPWTARPAFILTSTRLPAFRPVLTSIDQSRSKFLMVRAGYLVSRPRNNSGTSTEHMVTAGATARAQLQRGLLLSDRNRFDFRWVNDEPRHRYRNRLKLERTFGIGRFQFTPYAHTEVFYDLKPTEWSRLRYAAGAELSITKRTVLEGHSLRQNTWASVPQFVTALGSAPQFYPRRRDADLRGRDARFRNWVQSKGRPGASSRNRAFDCASRWRTFQFVEFHHPPAGSGGMEFQLQEFI